MPTFTPNFNFAKPTISGDVDTWGGLLNGNFDVIDTQLQTALGVTAANIGGGAGLFESKVSNQIRLKSLQPAATTNTAITSDGDEVFFGRTDEQTDVRGNLRDIPPNVRNANYTFALSDRGRGVIKNDGSEYAWTIPLESTTAFPDGAAISVINDGGAGNLTITPASGVTLITVAAVGPFVMIPNDARTLYKVGTNRWRLI